MRANGLLKVIRAIGKSFRQTSSRKPKLSKRKLSPEYQEARAELLKQFGHEPSDGDIQWRILAKEVQEHWLNRNWGFYRNTRFRQGEQCRKEKKLKNALHFYCWTCYLDANGPNNVGPPNPNFDYQPTQFSPRDKNIFAPGVIDRIRKIIQTLSLTEPKVQEIFQNVAHREHKAIRLPVEPESAWKKLHPALFAKKGPYD